MICWLHFKQPFTFPRILLHCTEQDFLIVCLQVHLLVLAGLTISIIPKICKHFAFSYIVCHRVTSVWWSLPKAYKNPASFTASILTEFTESAA